MAQKILKPLSGETQKLMEAAYKAAWEEGYAVWGFVFAQQPAEERLDADGKDFVVLTTFNNAQSVAGGNSIMEFIAKTDVAMDVIRHIPPEGFDLQQAHEQMLAPFANYKPELEKKPN